MTGRLLACLLGLSVLALAPPAAAQPEPPRWSVAPADGVIAFSGTHAGRGFEGRFARFTADIRFDPAAPDAAEVSVRIGLAGATTGDALRDRTLPQGDWFDVARHPEALFVLRGARRVSGDAADGRYEAEGRLTLRGREVAVPLPFRLVVTDGVARLEAETALDRLAFRIGAESDGTAQWVSREIRLRITLTARRG